MTGTQTTPSNVLPLPRWTLIIHGVQVLLAIIILGLAAFGVHWIAYNALIFAIVCSILTFAFCGYIIGTTLFFHALYNGFIVFGLHCLMCIFWLSEMGLVANLARIWGSLSSLYGYYGGYDYYYKRDLEVRSTLSKRESVPTIKQYWGALTAGALFGAAELLLWVGSGVLVFIYLNKHRKNAANNTQAQQLPPYPHNPNQPAAGPEKFAQTGVPQQLAPVYQQQPQQQPQFHNGVPQGYQVSPPSAPQSPQQHYAQPYMQPQHTGGYGQDPVGRTVSPLSPPQHSQPASQFNNNPNASELAVTPQNPNVPELSGGR
ncbi:hypothetical protein BU24DRAFT_37269 [Aaosphaeria arxii CBS 175.79]|uniref:MARVEL domain-containing protein n=1 Tax=Aaosphaeria arxii CBS 175.79 TaxID=1450172 RepID=A0A6A5YAN6_9PLEO|nr:uncharacterized protein BU24DRAFT_37269 [Aaosphaeria arxii CBS 175.79]KAF2022087.1 hypothetical protein BU24DRAFT_37269 [Aaosphaeria arxii CBS 175.79]